MKFTIKGSKLWMMISNHVHVYLGKGKLNYWQFILNRVLGHYQHAELDATDDSKKVIVMVDGYPGGQGGLTDRLRGALSVYSLCKENAWDFRFHFVYPFDLHDYLVPAEYDWSIDDKDVVRTIPYSQPIALYLMNLVGENRLDKRILKKQIESDEHKQYHIYTSAFFDKDNYPQLYRELFNPSDALRQAIDLNNKPLGTRYYAASFRFQELLGDLKEASECVRLNEQDRTLLLNKCIDELSCFIKRQLPEGYKLLVTSDSALFLEHAKSLEHVYVSPGKVFHPHYGADGDLPFMKSFVDLYTLMEAEKVFLFKTGLMYKSGFPEFAALLGGKQFDIHEF